MLILCGVAAVFANYSCSRLYAGEKDVPAAFEYRDIYLPIYSSDDNERLHLSYLDDVWGIWGHNLQNVFGDEPSNDVYAEVNGKVNDNQFCFSSDALYDNIVDFIHNHYLLSDSIYFAILPNDNSIVCLCEECVAAGNSAGNASPAVNNMIVRLAKKFPEHKFFTSDYLTTRETPRYPMPANTGVIVSAMDYPLSAVETPKEKEFIARLKKWGETTDKVYVWDYVQDFDDYFTPYPVFTIMQRRLQQYRDAGVNGVFINGSGNDYSTFGRIKKAVLAEMLINPDIDWEPVLRKYAKEYYPHAGNDIADFMVIQEKAIAQNGKKLPLYEGVNTALKIYLPEQPFIDFYNKAVTHKKAVSGFEKDDLEKMTDAMALTMLELKRLNNDVTNTAKLKERLGRLPGMGINQYNESGLTIQSYLNDYEKMETNLQATQGRNVLKGVRLNPKTALDEDYTDISIVTDGLLGMPSNYHNGNLIVSAETFKLGVPRVGGMKTLRVWMVNNPAFRIYLPDEVALAVDGVQRGVKVPAASDDAGHSYVDFEVPAGGEITLTFTKNPDHKTMAIDEIEAF